jgi:L-ascorbate metabolism protein UlaG (beta-lactamase superfamily)
MAVKIKWLGKACFMITANDGTQILTDPYPGMLACIRPETRVRIVTSSRGNTAREHDGPGGAGLRYIMAPGIFTESGISIKGVETLYDPVFGAAQGKNIIFNMRIDGLSVCHCGELGYPLNDGQVRAIGKVDILLLPIGGGFTLDPRGAADVQRQLRPAVVIPMHYITKTVGLPDIMPGKVGSFISASELRANAYEVLDVNPASIRQHAGVAVLKYCWS